MINEIDYWFLDISVEIPISFDLIVPYDRYEVYDAYLTPYNLTTNQIIETMYHLFQDGLLLAIDSRNLKSLNTTLIKELLTKGFSPSYKEVQIAFQPKENLVDNSFQEIDEDYLLFFLTEQGGEQWEKISNPKWRQFFHRGTKDWDFIPQAMKDQYYQFNSNTIWCADRDIGAKIIEIEHLFDYPKYCCYPIKGTEIWEILTPWHPTYWKTLPHGYLVNYMVELIEVDKNPNKINESQNLLKQRKDARDWYKNISEWYTNEWVNES
jgi:hypothetical protein